MGKRKTKCSSMGWFRSECFVARVQQRPRYGSVEIAGRCGFVGFQNSWGSEKCVEEAASSPNTPDAYMVTMNISGISSLEENIPL